MLDRIDTVVIILAGIGQTLFVLMWSVLPWWREWIGRALMVKSFALMVFIDSVIVWHFLPPWQYEHLTNTVIYCVMSVGIWSQVAAIRHEIHRAHSEGRDVLGTEPHDTEA